VLGDVSSSIRHALPLGRQAQRELYDLQHPPDCAKAKFLVCKSTFRQAAYLGLGARSLVFGRCLTYAFILGRVALLSMVGPGRYYSCSPRRGMPLNSL
jgi:hypothetical protein